MPKGEVPFRIRSGTPDDHGYVIATWIQRLYLHKPYSLGSKHWFFAAQNALIEKILRSSKLRFFVACDPRYEDQILGYLIGTGDDVLHWLHVKGEPDFRRQGIGTALMQHAFPGFRKERVFLTHRTPVYPFYREKWLIEVSAGKLNNL